MNWLVYTLCAIVGYFIGNIQTAVLLSRFKYKTDIRQMGSKNAGATNMLRTFGLKSGVVTFIGDCIKAVLAILFAWLIGGQNREVCGYIAAFAVVIGHNFPVFFNFKGGKGVACTLATLWMLTPFPEALCATVLAFTLILLTRIISLSALLSMAAYLALVIALNTANIPLIVLMSVLFVFMLIRHAENIKRLCNGTESKINYSKSKKSNSDTDIQP